MTLVYQEIYLVRYLWLMGQHLTVFPQTRIELLESGRGAEWNNRFIKYQTLDFVYIIDCFKN